LVWLGLAKLDDAVFLAFETTKMLLSRPFVQNFSFRILLNRITHLDCLFRLFRAFLSFLIWLLDTGR
jgi:hypothetical protein